MTRRKSKAGSNYQRRKRETGTLFLTEEQARALAGDPHLHPFDPRQPGASEGLAELLDGQLAASDQHKKAKH